MKKLELLLFVLMLGINASQAQSDIVITEIAYDQAETGIDSTEFLELYNKGLVPVDLTGYTFSAGIGFVFPTVIIEPGEFIVVTIDSLAMIATYGYEGAYQWFAGGLDDEGEAITLRDNAGVVVDAFFYSHLGSWPAEGAGTGKTIVLCDPESNNGIGSNWAPSERNAGIVVNDLDVYGSPGELDLACIPCEETTATIDETTCGPYTVPSGDETYDITGVYTDTLENVAGCDSVITINLTVGSATASEFAVVACGGYTLPSGDITYMFSTVVNDTIPNMFGCDSVMTIDITVNYSSASEISETACGSYTVPSGDETYTMSGVYNDTIPNETGCDSVITINLSVTEVDNGVGIESFDIIASQDGATYQWVDCDNDNAPIDGQTNQVFTPSADGNYAVEITIDGCTVVSDCVNFNALGITDNDLLSKVKLYPNPTNGLLNIDLGELTNATIQIISLDGRVVYHTIQNSNPILQVELINAAGVYFVQVQQHGAQAQYKLILQ